MVLCGLRFFRISPSALIKSFRIKAKYLYVCVYIVT